jgi:hypothetical protein
VLKIVGTNTLVLVMSRVAGGVAAGGCYNVLPMYVKEISQDDIRLV